MNSRTSLMRTWVASLYASSSAGFTLAVVTLSGFLAITLLVQLPSSITPAWLRAHRSVYQTVWPQAWSFFANTADSKTLIAYRISSTRFARASAVELSMSRQNTWGLGRVAQAQFAEALYFTKRIPRRYWKLCAEPLSHQCLASLSPYRLEDEFNPAQLCGLIVFIRASPSTTATLATDPGSVAAVQLECAA